MCYFVWFVCRELLCLLPWIQLWNFQAKDSDCLELCVRFFFVRYWKRLIKYIVSSSWKLKTLFLVTGYFFLFVWPGIAIAKNLNYKNIKKTYEWWLVTVMAIKKAKSIASQHVGDSYYWHKTDWLGEFRLLFSGLWNMSKTHNRS